MSSKSTTRNNVVDVRIINLKPLKAIEQHLYWISMIAKLMLLLLFIIALLQIPTGGESII